jgi:hypothetical protein
LYPSEVQVAAVHVGAPHWKATPPPPQLCPVGQVPQFSMLPQPSGYWPQLSPLGHFVSGVQFPPPHWLATPPPPHVCPVGQVPQLTVMPPQPSLCGPHAPG